MDREERLRDFSLNSGRRLNFLRGASGQKMKLTYVKDTPSENVRKFKEFESNLLKLDFTADQIDTIYKIFAAILLLGELKFDLAENSATYADLLNPEMASLVAHLLKVDEKKFQWALLNYCVIAQGHAERRRHTPDQAREARDSLASNIYSRLVDYIVNMVNSKLAFGRAV